MGRHSNACRWHSYSSEGTASCRVALQPRPPNTATGRSLASRAWHRSAPPSGVRSGSGASSSDVRGPPVSPSAKSPRSTRRTSRDGLNLSALLEVLDGALKKRPPMSTMRWEGSPMAAADAMAGESFSRTRKILTSPSSPRPRPLVPRRLGPWPGWTPWSDPSATPTTTRWPSPRSGCRRPN